MLSHVLQNVLFIIFPALSILLLLVSLKNPVPRVRYLPLRG
jgi:hypothetical protein